jgi:hypothetical protein
VGFSSVNVHQVIGLGIDLFQFFFGITLFEFEGIYWIHVIIIIIIITDNYEILEFSFFLFVFVCQMMLMKVDMTIYDKCI